MFVMNVFSILFERGKYDFVDLRKEWMIGLIYLPYIKISNSPPLNLEFADVVPFMLLEHIYLRILFNRSLIWLFGDTNMNVLSIQYTTQNKEFTSYNQEVASHQV